jgi:hypothetical protein
MLRNAASYNPYLEQETYMKNVHESKSGAANVVAIVIVAMVLIAGVAYFTSDVWRTRMNVAATEYAKWTPENIAKDPENYLNFVEAEATKALTSLKASKISMAMKRAELVNTLDGTKKQIANGDRALDELKSLYSSAEAEKKWPTTWQGRSMDEVATKSQILSLHKQVTGQKKLQTQVELALNKIGVQLQKIDEANTDTQSQLAEISTSREMLKVQKLTGDLTKQLASIKGSLEVTIGTISETSGPISLEQLTEQSAGVVDDAEFNKIMGL